MREVGAPEKTAEWGLVLALRTSPMNRRELLHALGEFRERVLSSPGCTGCRILEDSTDSNRFIWTQWWVDQAEAALGIQRTGFRALLGAVQLLGEVETMEWLGRRDGPPTGSRKTRKGEAGLDRRASVTASRPKDIARKTKGKYS